MLWTVAHRCVKCGLNTERREDEACRRKQQMSLAPILLQMGGFNLYLYVTYD